MLRRRDGFSRYALAVQYHGANFLGFACQGPDHEDRILSNGTDHRGLRTVQGRICDALSALVGCGNHENFQVSSRTDRGVHALWNTCHVDVRPRVNDDEIVADRSRTTAAGWDTETLKKGMNWHLSNQCHRPKGKRERRELRHGAAPEWLLSRRAEACSNELRVLSVANVPQTAPNRLYSDQPGCNVPKEVDWNIRFTCVGRTYVYRILDTWGDERNFAAPFEFDRSWRVASGYNPLDVERMNEAAKFLVGTHDFTSFRGNLCERNSPVVTMKEMSIKSTPYEASSYLGFPHRLRHLTIVVPRHCYGIWRELPVPTGTKYGGE